MLDSVIHFDRELFLYLNSLGNSYWDWLWIFITDKWSSIPLYLFLLFLLYKKTNARATLVSLFLVVLLIACTDQVSNLFKNGFQRLRPCQMGWDSRTLVGCGRYGFPSAHSFSSMALAIFMGKILRPYYKNALYFLIGWSILLGLSRIYLGVHYPGDVLTGFSLGVLFGFGFFYLRKLLLLKLNWWSQLKFKRVAERNYADFEDCWLCKYQVYFLYFALVIVSVLYVRTELNPQLFVLEDTPYEIYYEMLALFISLFGFTLRFFTQAFNTERSQVTRQNPNLQISELNTTGVYSVMRHPMFVGNFLLCFGPVLWTGNYFFILLFFSTYWIYISEMIDVEEYFLQKKYGAAFEEWKQKTPSYFPNFKNYKKSDFPFHWRRILRKEIGILFLLLLVYSSFEVLGELVEKAPIDINMGLLILGSITGLIYFYLRYQKYKTDYQTAD